MQTDLSPTAFDNVIEYLFWVKFNLNRIKDINKIQLTTIWIEQFLGMSYKLISFYIYALQMRLQKQNKEEKIVLLSSEFPFFN